MHDFKVGDRVSRINKPHNEVQIGNSGVVVRVDRDNVRVRYDAFVSKYEDGCYNQLPRNLLMLTQDRRAFINPSWEKPESNHAADAMRYGVSAIEARKLMLEAERMLETIKREQKERDQKFFDDLNRMTTVAAERRWGKLETQLLPPIPSLGPDIGMFIRDGMTSKEAHAMIDQRRFEEWSERVNREKPKVRAASPGPKPITVHRAPRQWLTESTGYRYVLWNVSSLPDWRGS